MLNSVVIPIVNLISVCNFYLFATVQVLNESFEIKTLMNYNYAAFLLRNIIMTYVEELLQSNLYINQSNKKNKQIEMQCNFYKMIFSSAISVWRLQ